MALIKRKNLVKEYVYDFAVDGGATGEIELRATDPGGNALPEGFIVTKASAYVETAITPTAGELTFGTDNDPDGFLTNARSTYNTQYAVVRSGEVAGALLWDDTNDHEIDYRVGSAANLQAVHMEIGTEAVTAGKIRLFVEGYMPSDADGVE